MPWQLGVDFREVGELLQAAVVFVAFVPERVFDAAPAAVVVAEGEYGAPGGGGGSIAFQANVVGDDPVVFDAPAAIRGVRGGQEEGIADGSALVGPSAAVDAVVVVVFPAFLAVPPVAFVQHPGAVLPHGVKVFVEDAGDDAVAGQLEVQSQQAVLGTFKFQIVFSFQGEVSVGFDSVVFEVDEESEVPGTEVVAEHVVLFSGEGILIASGGQQYAEKIIKTTWQRPMSLRITAPYDVVHDPAVEVKHRFTANFPVQGFFVEVRIGDKPVFFEPSVGDMAFYFNKVPRKRHRRPIWYAQSDFGHGKRIGAPSQRATRKGGIVDPVGFTDPPRIGLKGAGFNPPV
ncbi:MAG: hypothetical protein WD037_06040 [Balneolales bacterium]